MHFVIKNIKKRFGVKALNVGICGLGTVGGGTFSVLTANAKEISLRAGRDINVTHIGARSNKLGLELGDVKVSKDIFDVATDPNVDVVIELIGGYELAKKLVETAIENGKHVVTANKALIAEHGNELFAKAAEKGVTIAYEAAVAGGIPIIKALREGLSGNKINWLAGIINGTGNFILTEMRDKGRAFEDVLKEAQELGYAEADPTFDVEGIDAAHKLTILASIAFGIPLQFDKTFTEGISEISAEDVTYAEELGYRIKHLGVARQTQAGVELRVHPTLIPEKQLIANVDGVLNAVMVNGDAVGDTLYSGPGAGSTPTASSVVADIVDLARNIDVPALGYTQLDASINVLPVDQIQTAYYLRLSVKDEVGVMATVTNILSENNINIEAIIQKEPKSGETQVPLIMLTQTVIEADMNKAIDAMQALDTVLAPVAKIRVESLS
jgi:homoserine dehydrogenase